MTKKQFDKINNDVNKLLNGGKIKGIDLSVYDIRELVNVLENIKNKPEFINGNVKKFCDKYGIKVCEYGIGWKNSHFSLTADRHTEVFLYAD